MGDSEVTPKLSDCERSCPRDDSVLSNPTRLRAHLSDRRAYFLVIRDGRDPRWTAQCRPHCRSWAIGCLQVAPAPGANFNLDVRHRGLPLRDARPSLRIAHDVPPNARSIASAADRLCVGVTPAYRSAVVTIVLCPK